MLVVQKVQRTTYCLTTATRPACLPPKAVIPFAACFVSLMAIGSIGCRCYGQIDLEKPPISYSETEGQNVVTELMEALKSGTKQLDYDPHFGYLPAVLQEFEIPVSSQGLVFSKTSMQVRYITPRNPRAIYFSDDVYVGWVRGSSLMEISTWDPKLGAAFYSVKMLPNRPLFSRENYNCLSCHTSTLTQGVPGHTVRSVYPKPDGNIDVQRPSYVTDHASPFSQRWGGWYVSGMHGTMRHMGNAVVRSSVLDTRRTGNLADLSEKIESDQWLSPYSDIVALMVLEHQTQMHNLLARADFRVRSLIYNAKHDRDDAVLGEVPSSERQDVLQVVLQKNAQEIVAYLLFSNEAPLDSEIEPSSPFTKDFSQRGLRDAKGRSLRDFDLKTRLFAYPCSYLIYSKAVQQLQPQLREAVFAQLWTVLTAETTGDDFPNWFITEFSGKYLASDRACHSRRGYEVGSWRTFGTLSLRT